MAKQGAALLVDGPRIVALESATVLALLDPRGSADTFTLASGTWHDAHPLLWAGCDTNGGVVRVLTVACDENRISRFLWLLLKPEGWTEESSGLLPALPIELAENTQVATVVGCGNSCCVVLGLASCQLVFCGLDPRKSHWIEVAHVIHRLQVCDTVAGRVVWATGEGQATPVLLRSDGIPAVGEMFTLPPGGSLVVGDFYGDGWCNAAAVDVVHKSAERLRGWSPALTAATDISALTKASTGLRARVYLERGQLMIARQRLQAKQKMLLAAEAALTGSGVAEVYPPDGLFCLDGSRAPAIRPFPTPPLKSTAARGPLFSTAIELTGGQGIVYVDLLTTKETDWRAVFLCSQNCRIETWRTQDTTTGVCLRCHITPLSGIPVAMLTGDLFLYHPTHKDCAYYLGKVDFGLAPPPMAAPSPYRLRARLATELFWKSDLAVNSVMDLLCRGMPGLMRTANFVLETADKDLSITFTPQALTILTLDQQAVFLFLRRWATCAPEDLVLVASRRILHASYLSALGRAGPGTGLTADLSLASVLRTYESTES